MSWGERSCSKQKAPKNEFGGCSYATFSTCNVDCPYYTNNGLKPDSEPSNFQKNGMSRKERRALKWKKQ